MRVNAIPTGFYRNNGIYYQQPTVRMTKKNNPTFRAASWVMNPSDVGVSNYGSITSREAERIYAKLSCGNYF